jgi:F0F1-type ATP synthase assembly protein I
MQDEPHGRPDTSGPPASSTGLGTAGKYAGIGIQFGASIVLFLYVGQWVDRRLGTTPIFLIVGVFVGATAAFYSIYKRLMRDLKKEEEAQSRASKDA